MRPATLILSLLSFSQAPLSDASSHTWMDWDGLQTCHPADLVSDLSSEEAIVDLITSSSHSQIKTVGAGHSFSSIALTDDSSPSTLLLSLDQYAGIVRTELQEDGTTFVEVKAGTRLRDLNTMLSEMVPPLALVNLGATAAQSIAGAIATGTHGTGRSLGSISAAVEGLRIIDASGRVWDSREDPDVVKFGRVALGVLGIVSTVTIRAVPMFKMKKTVLDVPLDELLANHDAWVARYERFQWSFVPYTNTASVILREEVPFDAPVDDCWVSPTPAVCTDLSYKTLVDSLPAYENRTLYTEMEMFVPVEHAVAAVTDFIEYQSQVKPKHDDSKCSLFTNIRYVAADDIPTSMMHNRDIAVLSFICLGDKDATGDSDEFAMYAQGLENITKTKYDGVPHWGKENWATGEELNAFYDFTDFLAFREKVDPGGVFLNEYTRERLSLL